MKHADQVLAEGQVVAAVYEALAKRHPRSRTRGRLGAPAEAVLRLMLLKPIRNWSYAVLERQVRANLVYRTSLGWVEPKCRMVQIARDQRIVQGHKLRGDTTVVETNIRYPADSGLLGDGVRVRTRALKKRTGITGTVGTKLRGRSRSVKRGVMEIARAARSKGRQSQQKLQRGYRQLLEATSRVVGQAKRFAKEIAESVKRSANRKQPAMLEGLRQEIEVMLPRVKQVIRQTKTHIFGGDTHAEGKSFSLFEPSTEIIRKGKAGKPNEFGKLVKLQEAENRIAIDYEVYRQRPNDADLLLPAIQAQEQKLGRVPRRLAADAGFYSA